MYKSILNQLEIIDTFNTKFKYIISEVILQSDFAKASTNKEKNVVSFDNLKDLVNYLNI